MDTPKQKPTLMSASHDKQQPGQRILANLEQGGKPLAPLRRTATRQLDGWIVGVGLLVLVLALFAWSMRNKVISPTATARSATPPQAEQQAQHELATQPKPVQQAELEVQAAAIINEVGPPARRAAPAVASAPSPALPLKAAPPHAVTPLARAAATSATTQRNATSATAPRAASATATAAAAPAGTANRDTDVVLLTALVAHASQPAVVTSERSRDVVERRDGDSTESLLARCKQLGLIEGMLCRSRICAGRWDGDAACRAPHH